MLRTYDQIREIVDAARAGKNGTKKRQLFHMRVSSYVFLIASLWWVFFFYVAGVKRNPLILCELFAIYTPSSVLYEWFL